MRPAVLILVAALLPVLIVVAAVVMAMDAHAATARSGGPGPCGGYRQLVAEVGLPGMFCGVIRCETAGTFDPAARNGSSTGLAMLHKPSHEARAKRLGFTWPQMFQARPNLTVAADLYREQGLRPWRFSRYCWAPSHA